MADFTYVATWSVSLYVSFVIDVIARRIIGWRIARSMHADLVLDALMEQALCSRSGIKGVDHHCDSKNTRPVVPGRPDSNPEISGKVGAVQEIIELLEVFDEESSEGGVNVRENGKPVTPAQMEISRLCAENARLRMETEILKKAAAYFAKESL